MTPADRTAFLRAVAAKLCRGTAIDPDDLVQDILEKLLRHPMPDDVRDERGWLARTVRNRFVDALRRRAARREVMCDPDPIQAAFAGAPWDALTEDDVRAELASLPREQSTTFAMFALDGCSYLEIARRLAISKATVGTRILRARARLRLLLAVRLAPEM